jgi:mRNA-degrading endonuclease RelE of RelBE toxin-antitoxin system
MSYNVKTIPRFEKDLKHLSKKYPSLKVEYINLVHSLKQSPEQGTPIGNHCFKIRLAIASKGKGKSGGARVIAHLQVVNKNVFLLSIYDKSEQENISDTDLNNLLGQIPT